VKPNNIFSRALGFIAFSNIFISVCAASVAAYTTKLFLGEIKWTAAGITLGTTFIMYNTQQLLLGYLSLRSAAERNAWFSKNRALLWLIFFAGFAEVYPLAAASYKFVWTYGVAALISLLYFLPFSNLRSIPLLKSFIIGLVWTLVCVVAPLESRPGPAQVNFACGQLLFITALCVLFNIRDVDQDKRTNTFTVPVLYGITTARIFSFLLLLAYAIVNYYVSREARHLLVTATTFLLGVAFTLRATPGRHPYFYLLGVDGLILFQSIFGLAMLHL
jgi:4-hydroxybenzoate polyprenyltransferase